MACLQVPSKPLQNMQYDSIIHTMKNKFITSIEERKEKEKMGRGLVLDGFVYGSVKATGAEHYSVHSRFTYSSTFNNLQIYLLAQPVKKPISDPVHLNCGVGNKKI